MAEHQELLSAIEAVKQMPSESAYWDRVEALVEQVQRPSDVSELFQCVLGTDIDAGLASDIGQRAVRFYEAWYGEDSSELPDTLERVLRIDPNAEWAFQRLSVAYTVGERWQELLNAYDRTIAHADRPERRMQLLEEAAQVAKDFAALPDRAIDYMHQRMELDPNNGSLAMTLERLLERQGRYRDLVNLHEGRLTVQSKTEARETRVRMAAVQLRRLRDAEQALELLRSVFDEEPEHRAALEVVEEIMADQEAAQEVRAECHEILKRHFLNRGEALEVIRVLEASLDFVQDEARCVTLRELVDRLAAVSEYGRAQRHQAALLQLEPTPKEREGLRSLAQRTGDYEHYQSGLLAAAKAAEPPVSLELLMEAGRTLENQLGDMVRAIDCYGEVFVAPEGPLTLSAGRQLITLLEQTQQEAPMLEACSRMAELETDEVFRRRLLGQVASLAEKLGDEARAGRAWQERVTLDATDVEALDALVRFAAEARDWPRLAELLSARVRAPGAAVRRRHDLRWLAEVLAEQLHDLDSAIGVWREIQQTFGEDNETVNALTDLLSRAEYWHDLEEVLNQAADGEIRRFTTLQAQLGDAYRLRLSRPLDAALRYRSALQVDPTCKIARDGQLALLADPDCCAVAADSLADAYQQTDEWQALLSLLEPRLSTESSSTVRAEILIEAAGLYEEQADDPAAALACLRRAFALIPDDRGTEREIRRLAEGLSAWEAVVEAYRETIATFEVPTPRVAELRYDEGEVLELRVGDREAALLAYQQAAEVAPGRTEFAQAVLRLAGQLGRYDGVARCLVAHAQATGRVDDGLVDVLLDVVQEQEAFAAIASAMTRSLRGAEMAGALARELYCQVAQVELQRCDNRQAAEQALLQACRVDPEHVLTLQQLAEVQRARPSLSLIDTLTTLADKLPRNLDPLQEACEVALEQLNEVDLALPILQRLHETAAGMFKYQREAQGALDSQSMVTWALERLVRIYEESGESQRAVQLLAEAATLPFEVEATQGLRHDAAKIAAYAGDKLRAIELYRDVLQVDPADRAAMEQLAELYRAAERLPELLALRSHELQLGPSPDQQLVLRLSIAEILGQMEARGGRLQLLRDNLRQSPGHQESVEELSSLLRSHKAFQELGEVLRDQVQTLTQLGDVDRAAELVRQAALLYEADLGDTETALRCYETLFDLQPQGDAGEALARLHTERGEHGRAATWLALRLDSVAPAGRPQVALALAQAYLAAEQSVKARNCLEQLLEEAPEHAQGRILLADLYREQGAHEPLARLLVGGVSYVVAPSDRLALLREAADLYCGPLQAPAEAIDALQQARELAPQDERLGIMLATGLCAAGRHDEAAALLQQLIEAYGRKRSTARAELHFQLAKVLASGGDRAAALDELETATRMDLGHAAALHMLGRLSREAGELERSERALRGLLMLVRRRPTAAFEEAGPSEVFYELHGLAKARGQDEQAAELLQSAMEAAAQSDQECQRFARALGDTDGELLLQVFDLRLSKERDPTIEAEIMGRKAEVLDAQVGRSEEALQLLLDALALSPHNEQLHELARGLSVRIDATARYLQACEQWASAAAARGDAPGKRDAARLRLRMAVVWEQDLSDLEQAAKLLGDIEASGECVVDAWLAMSRIAGAKGDLAEQRRVLWEISRLPANEDHDGARAEALYVLAELALPDEEQPGDVLAYVKRATALRRDNQRVRGLLSALLARGQNSAEVLGLLRQVAVDTQDHELLLRWHKEAAATGAATFSQIRDGVALARRQGDWDMAESLLRLAWDRVAQQSTKESVTWVCLGLAECCQRRGNIQEAMTQLQQAVVLAGPEEAQGIRRQLAELAGGEDGDLAIATEAYEGIWRGAPSDRAVWEPLLEVYRKRGDRAAFEAFVQRAEGVLDSPGDRRALRMAQARFLIEVSNAELEAVDLLNGLLFDEPANKVALQQLMDIYQRHNMRDQLGDLLRHQFDRARDEQDLAGVAEIGLQLGRLYREQEPEEALGIYRAALEWMPDHRGLLHACAELLGPDTDPRDRAEVMLGLLKAGESRGAEAVTDLAELWAELGDDDKLQETLELGLSVEPANKLLRERLQSYYRERGLWRPLAAFCCDMAARAEDHSEAIEGYRAAATIYRDELDDMPAAAEVLRKALALAPEDLSLLGEVSRNLAAAGQTTEALADVDRLLESHGGSDGTRLQLLLVRAELLRKVERHVDAVRDLEEAYGLERDAVREVLVDALEVLKGQALIEEDRALERSATLRLVQLYDAAGDGEQGRQILAEWCETELGDVEALRALRRRDEVAERYEDVARTCARLLDLEEGEARVEAALGLVDAYYRLQRLDEARVGLERAYRDMPDNGMLRSRLLQLYQALGARPEQAAILLEQGQDEAAELAVRLGHLHHAATLYLELNNAHAAMQALSLARDLDPSDQNNQILLVDIQLKLGQFDEARATLSTAMEAHKRRRSPELALLQQRMARLCATLGDSVVQLQWLQQALDTDRKNGEIAAELVEVAVALEDYDTAMKALRSITMMESPQPITRAMAFLKQAQIAVVRGDTRRALHWARKAKALDDSLLEANALLAELS